MNGETKRHIDAARQVLVGVVPSPTAQIDQITNALIYKFMDDMDQAAIKAGGNPSFFTGDLERYAWTRLMDTRIGNQERMNLYSEALLKFSQAKQLPPLFRDLFKSAFLPYRSPETLNMFLKEIEYFDYSHSEELGNAYEYLLSIMSSQGDAGQFRTPRHIIDFMVEVVAPTKDDTVLDPACGTAGFLISAYKHILRQHDGKDDPEHKEKPLTPEERKKLFNNFEGYDIDPTMARIAQVNMYLHQFKNPHIYQYDTLSQEERWNDRFDVIMANPPFMSPKGGIKPHSKFSIQSSRSEVLFVDYIMEHLKPKGRAAIIVPEGIIFQSGKSHVQLRKNLVEDGLYAVVSLPSGVFAPYSGVKTSILLFNNELAKQRREILFVKIDHDGYGLGAQRKPIQKNDLPHALEILNMWRTGEKEENKRVLYVEKTTIAANGDFNLSGDRYRVATDSANAKWPMVELGEVCEVYQAKTITSKEIKESGKYKVYGANGIIGFFDEYNHEDAEIAITCRGATCGTVNFTDPQSWITGNAMVVKPKENTLNKMYLYHLLRSTDLTSVITGAAQPQITASALKPFKIPLPPLEIQEQLVEELDGYAGIITAAKQIAANWKPKIEIDPEWEKVKLGEVCKTSSGGTPSKANPEFWIGEMPWVSSKDMKMDYLIDTEDHISERAIKESATKVVDTGTLLGVVRSGILQHTFPVSLTTRPMSHNQDILAFRPDKSRLNAGYLFYTFKAENKKILCEGIKPGVTVQSFHSDFFKNYKIYLPPLDIQRQIVEKNEAERLLVESAKKLISIYEQKTKDVVTRLWSE